MINYDEYDKLWEKAKDNKVGKIVKQYPDGTEIMQSLDGQCIAMKTKAKNLKIERCVFYRNKQCNIQECKYYGRKYCGR